MNEKELEFAIFCIESLAEYLEIDQPEAYDMLTQKSNLLYSYIIPCYDSLHTQSKTYISEELTALLKERGIL